MTVFHRHGQHAHFVALFGTNGGIPPFGLDLAAKQCGDRSAGSFERDIGCCGAGHLVKFHLCQMVGRAFTRPRKCQFLGVRLGVVNHVLQRVHIAVGPHDDGIGCVMEHID